MAGGSTGGSRRPLGAPFGLRGAEGHLGPRMGRTGDSPPHQAPGCAGRPV